MVGDQDGSRDDAAQGDPYPHIALAGRVVPTAGQIGFITLWFGACFVGVQLVLAAAMRAVPALAEVTWPTVAAAAASQILFLVGIWCAEDDLPFIRASLRRITPVQLVIAAGSAYALARVFLMLVDRFPPDAPPPIQNVLSNPTALILASFFSVVVAPFGEEIFFRGALYPFVRARWGFVTAALTVSSVFTALHTFQLRGYPLGLGLIFALSMIFTTAREKTGAVTMSWAMHLFYNLTFALYNLGDCAKL